MRCWGQWEIFLKVQLTPVEVLVKWLLILFVDYLRALPCWACSHLSQTTVEFFSILHYSKMEIIRQRPVEGFDSASSFAIGITKQFLRLFLLGNRCLDRVSSARFYYSLSRENKCQVCNPRPRLSPSSRAWPHGQSSQQRGQTYFDPFLCFARTEIMGPCWLPVTWLFISNARLNGHDSSLKNGLTGLVETKEHRKWRGGFVLPLLGGCIYCLDLEKKLSY